MVHGVRNMNTGDLDSRSNDTKIQVLYTGDFGQPDGFGSVLSVTINSAGETALKLDYKGMNQEERSWTVTLTNEQRQHLAHILGLYSPKLSNIIEDNLNK